MSYDERAFGHFGWAFVNAGEEYRKLEDVAQEDQLEMLGLFKQATFGDCKVEEATKEIFPDENRNRELWLKFKGMDQIEAMEKYIEKARQLAQVHNAKESSSSSSSSS